MFVFVSLVGLDEFVEEEPRVWPLPVKAEDDEEEEACLVIVFVRPLKAGVSNRVSGRGEVGRGLTLYLRRALGRLSYRL